MMTLDNLISVLGLCLTSVALGFALGYARRAQMGAASLPSVALGFALGYALGQIHAKK